MTRLSEAESLRQRLRVSTKFKGNGRNSLDWKEFDGVKHLRKRSRMVPWGYAVSEKHEGFLEPVELELAALEEARTLIKKRCRYTDVTAWLEQVTGRKISIMGLHKALRRGY